MMAALRQDVDLYISAHQGNWNLALSRRILTATYWVCLSWMRCPPLFYMKSARKAICCMRVWAAAHYVIKALQYRLFDGTIMTIFFYGKGSVHQSAKLVSREYQGHNQGSGQRQGKEQPKQLIHFVSPPFSQITCIISTSDSTMP